MSLVKHVLEKKSSGATWTVGPQDSLRTALQLLDKHNIGAVLVMDGDTLAGVFSERDLARMMARSGAPDLDAPISGYMTPKVFFAQTEDSVDECMKLMTSKHIRHLPVMSEGKLVGMISINDLARESIDGREIAIRSLENYITGQSNIG